MLLHNLMARLALFEEIRLWRRRLKRLWHLSVLGPLPQWYGIVITLDGFIQVDWIQTESQLVGFSYYN